MADPMIPVPRMSPEILAEVHKRLDAFMQDIYSSGFIAGYERGEADSLDRVLKLARKASNGHQFTTTVVAVEAAGEPAGPGADTHKLIETVLRATPSGKATPTEIAASPSNTKGLARDAVRNALRRGVPHGRYGKDGKGRYFLGKEAQK